MLEAENELLNMFVEESREHLDHLEPDLLSLESNKSDSELINRIFRAVHSIKGASGFFGLKQISQLSHVMENLMSRVREGSLVPSQAMVDALLAGADKLRVMVDDVNNSNGMGSTAEINALNAVLSAGGQAMAPPPPTPVAAPGNPAIDPSLVEQARKKGHFFYKVRLYTHKDIKDRGKNPLDYFKKTESVGQFLDSYTDISFIKGMSDALEKDLVCVFVFSTVLEKDLMTIALEVPEEQIEQLTPEQVLSMSPLTQTESVPAAAETAPVVEPSKPVAISLPVAPPAPTESSTAVQKASSRQKVDETIRVSVALLDDLMNLAGEMVLGRNQLLRTSEHAARNIPGLPGILQNISLITSDLQEKVMRTRLQPVGSIFGKFTRIIRDMAHQLKKEMDLKLFGEDVELDKSILEMLSDPLTHLIRNCADHAIEPPDERERLNKPRVGSICLSASHVGGQVQIEVVDDGRGLNPEKLRRKAVEKGVLKAEEASALSDRQAFNLIFAPGFSTAEKVTDVSGRGVGMDVVKTNIEKLGGSIELDSELNRGTRIVLRLPLTLAIIPAMIVGAENRRFAIPQINLEEIVKAGGKNRIESVQGAKVLRLRGKLLPVVSLREVLGAKKALPAAEEGKADACEQPSESGHVLVLKVEHNRFGLIVETLLDSEEIVVKPISTYLKSGRCYSGATIMGDGRVAMILDAAGIASAMELQFVEIKKAGTTTAVTQGRVGAEDEKQSLLLFRNGESELLGINLVMVSRIEKIRAKDIEKVGPREVIKYGKGSLRLIRLHDFMQISAPKHEPDELYVIVPKLVKNPLGIIVTRVEDAIETPVMLDRESVQGPGILGSAVISGRVTLLLNIYSLFEAADPEHYKPLAGSGLQGKRILLAEDTAFFRTVTEQYLKEFDIQVDTAVDGLEAWDKLNRNSYDLLLTDIEMPGMNGFELTQRVRSHSTLANLPVIALTALSADQHHQRGMEAGVDAYEVKLDKDRLRKALEHLIRHGRNVPPPPSSGGDAHAKELVDLEKVGSTAG